MPREFIKSKAEVWQLCLGYKAARTAGNVDWQTCQTDIRLSLKQGMGNRGIGESGNRGIRESGNRGIRESGNPGIGKSGNPGIGESGNRGIRES